MAVKIQDVLPRSIAQQAGLAQGETLVSINGFPIADVLDYRFYLTEEALVLIVEGHAGTRREINIEKSQYEDLGLTFATYLMDRQHSCKNKCEFCFVDQMPPGMRESLYFKDDDSRLSFLFGNYITMTNLQDADIDRIIKMRISPVNISVHSTNPALRAELMKNPAAADSLRYLARLAEHDIKLNTQLVLCPGRNDGAELLRSLRDLSALWPAVQSIACVPVGLTKYRAKLPPLECYTAEQAAEVLDTVEQFADHFAACHGVRLAYPADEFFLLAGRPVPEAAYYGAFDQLENGVGLLALLRQEFEEALENTPICKVQRHVTIATGVAASGLLKELARLAMRRYEGLQCRVKVIKNKYFGRNVTVAGLLTGRDLTEQLRSTPRGSEVLITSSMLRHERDRFLDDATPGQISVALGVTLTPVDNDGYALLNAMLGRAAQ